MAKLSIVLSVYNEETKIKECLESLSTLRNIPSEIVVVDNSSIDNTAKIAKKYTNKVYTHKNDPSAIDIQKNFGFEKAESEWILSIDADERITPELAEEIKSVVSTENKFAGYWIPRKNILFGKWIEHTGWYPDYQLRLFKKDIGKFEKKHVHEPLQLNGEAGYLKEHLIHENYQSISEFLRRTTEIYAPNEAQELLEKGYKLDWRDAIQFPVKEFLSRYFSREGYKDGFHGLVLSMLMAFYHFVVFAYLWEKSKFIQYKEANLENTEKEFKKVEKGIRYWFINEKIKSEKNPIKKGIRRIIRKSLS